MAINDIYFSVYTVYMLNTFFHEFFICDHKENAYLYLFRGGALINALHCMCQDAESFFFFAENFFFFFLNKQYLDKLPKMHQISSLEVQSYQQLPLGSTEIRRADVV